MGNSSRWSWTRAGALAAVVLCTAASAQADDITVVLKRGVLTITGERDGNNHVSIIPTATGLIVGGDVPGDDTINGGNRQLTFDQPIRDWKFRFQRARSASVNIQAPAEGVPALRPRNVAFVCGDDGSFRAEGVEFQRGLNVDCRRARETAGLRLIDCTVQRWVTFRSGTARTRVLFQNTEVGGAAKLFTRNFGPTLRQEDRADVDLTDSSFGSLSLGMALRSPGFNAPIGSARNTIAGKATFRGDIDVVSQGDSVGGKFSVEAGRGEHDHQFTDLTVTGKVNVRAGSVGDTIDFTRATLGKLTVIGGKQSDRLITRDTTFAEGSRFSGGRGSDDTWLTSGDESALKTKSVETIDPLP